MLTFFTTPKRFLGHINVIQRNALRSWAALHGDVRVLVFGEEEGAAEVCGELGFLHVPQVERNEYGTPLLNDMFAQAEARSEHRVLCYINADILLMPDFLVAIEHVVRRKHQFLMVGCRTDFDLAVPLDFRPGWDEELRGRVSHAGKRQRPTAIDYFAFTRGVWGRLPPFAIGRTAWDNWLIYRAREHRVPVIDASDAVLAVHQNHDYGHTVQAPGQRGYNWVWKGPEARLNLALAGGPRHLFTIWDSTHVLTPEGLSARNGTGLGGGIWSYRRSALYRN